MAREAAPSQRHLTGLRIRLGDGEHFTKYVFPFVDASWAVPFYIVDAVTLGPRLLRGDVELRSGTLHAKDPNARLEPLATLAPSAFDELVHFDPWWVFKGVAGVDREHVEAVLASNVAGTFDHEGSSYKLHDFAFDATLRSLVTLEAKDPLFRPKPFHRGDLALLTLRKPPRT